jgi:putative Holliday junction resolvase
MGRVLGVDFGTVRLGLALSDPAGVTAQPLEVISVNDSEAIVGVVAQRVRELEVEEVVVGIPVRLDGTHGPAAVAAEAFAQDLEAETGLPVRRWDERLSTREAERAMSESGGGARRRRGSVDKVAAALVLRAYLESRRSP